MISLLTLSTIFIYVLACPASVSDSCEVLLRAAANLNLNSNSVPFASSTVVAMALCYENGPASAFRAIQCLSQSSAALDPKTLPRLDRPFFDSATAKKGSMTKQNFIDLYFGALSSVQSQSWPSSAETDAMWNRIATWTGFQNSQIIPYANVADYLQYYSYVSASPAPTCASDTSSCAMPTESTCAALFTACVNSDVVVNTAFSTPTCILAATCFDGGVAAFTNALACRLPPKVVSADPKLHPRTTTNGFAKLVNVYPSTSVSITSQQFIDAYYSRLTYIGSTTWPNPQTVLAVFKKIQHWCGFDSTGVIPMKNFADFLQYSYNI